MLQTDVIPLSTKLCKMSQFFVFHSMVHFGIHYDLNPIIMTFFLFLLKCEVWGKHHQSLSLLLSHYFTLMERLAWCMHQSQISWKLRKILLHMTMQFKCRLRYFMFVLYKNTVIKITLTMLAFKFIWS